jgi:hypothetical protein
MRKWFPKIFLSIKVEFYSFSDHLFSLLRFETPCILQYSFLVSVIMSSPIPVLGSSIGEVFDHSPEVPPVCCSGGLLARNHSAVGVAPTILCLDYPQWQRSCFTMVDKKVLHHNYDIPVSVSMHFLDKSTGMTDGPRDICVHECMFLAGVRLSFPPLSGSCSPSWGLRLGINAKRLEVFLFNLFVVAYSVLGRDSIDPRVLKYFLGFICIPIPR